MANRRMMSKQIFKSDLFLDMPLSAQALYAQLILSADDDGFLNGVKRIRREIGASDDDLKILYAKGFLIYFEESGVTAITHWRVHNSIRKDRYTETSFLHEKEQLELSKTGIYTLRYADNLPATCQQGTDVATKWQPNGNQAATQVNLSKDRLNKSSPLDSTKIENGRNVDNVNNIGGGGGKTQKNQKSFTDLMGAIKQQIEYDCLICDYEKGQVDLAVQCIAELYTAESGIKINGATYPKDMCMERAGQIDDQHTRYALDMAEKAEGIHNVKAYLKAVLFNAPVTMDMYYKNLLSNEDKLR